MADHVQKTKATIILQGALEGPDRLVDVEIGRALGWRVSYDEWWNWRGYVEGKGPFYDPPGDAWCIRRDARKDAPCNEALPTFTFMVRHDAQRIIDDA
jgi:hypothetical protein